jgi:hypothetical protein
MGDQTTNQHSARYVLERATTLVTGDRAVQHGDMRQTHQTIADLWNTYLGQRTVIDLMPHDVAIMMVLLKVARARSGRFNPDDYIDMAGYAAIALECSVRPRAVATSMPVAPVPQPVPTIVNGDKYTL